MRSPEPELLEVAWFLSKYGKENPPAVLGGAKWKDAVALFYPRFGAGKTSVEFYNSLKNCRDRFDSWLSDTRRGWRNDDGSPRELPHASQLAMNKMEALTYELAEQRILSLISVNTSEQEHADLTILNLDKNLDDTMRERLVASRLGQGEFRKNCLKLYPACPVTGITFLPLLRASHIKAWSACESAQERLDPYNGIMLAPHIDVLFDQGWISFGDDGEVLISDELDAEVVKLLSLNVNKPPCFPNKSMKYLHWHRDKKLRKNRKKLTKKS